MLGVVSSGLSLGLAAGALLAALFFLAAIFVMKIALTAMLCVLLVSGALVIALLPLPQGEGLARLWGAGLLAAVTIPVSWALVFSVVGLVASDALVGHGLGPGLELAVKPFVAVACLYLVYKTPGFLVAQARMLGVRLGGTPGLARGAPGEARLRRDGARARRAPARPLPRAGRGRRASRRGQAANVSRPPGVGRTRATAGMALRARRRRGAVGLVAAAGGQGRGADLRDRRRRRRGGGGAPARRASARAVRAGGRAARDWWRNPGSGVATRAAGHDRGANGPRIRASTYHRGASVESVRRRELETGAPRPRRLGVGPGQPGRGPGRPIPPLRDRQRCVPRRALAPRAPGTRRRTATRRIDHRADGSSVSPSAQAAARLPP